MKALKVIGSIVVVIIVFFLAINIIPPKKVMETNPFRVEEGNVMIAAHRGGKKHNPENTLMAFNAAVNTYHADILEMDMCLTKDNEIVIIHNLYVNDYCNVEEVKNTTEHVYVNDLTLAELKTLNFAYKFAVDELGNAVDSDYTGTKTYPYRDLDNLPEGVVASNLRIITLNELFANFYTTNPEMLFIIEIKDEGEKGMLVADKLEALLTNTYPNYLNRVVVGTFHTEIENYLKNKHPNILRGASVGGAASFVITQMVGVNLFDPSSFNCLQIPMERTVKGIKLNLTKKSYVNRAHRRNIAVQYWTINDKEDMKLLIDYGVDAIMTDNPKLLYDTLVEMGIR